MWGVDYPSLYGIIYFSTDACTSCLNSFPQETGRGDFRTTGKLQLWIFTSGGWNAIKRNRTELGLVQVDCPIIISHVVILKRRLAECTPWDILLLCDDLTKAIGTDLTLWRRRVGGRTGLVQVWSLPKGSGEEMRIGKAGLRWEKLQGEVCSSPGASRAWGIGFR